MLSLKSTLLIFVTLSTRASVNSNVLLPPKHIIKALILGCVIAAVLLARAGTVKAGVVKPALAIIFAHSILAPVCRSRHFLLFARLVIELDLI
jgi:Mg/Co/Ni transporter MgtE